LKRLTIAGLLITLALPAAASTPGAWAKLEREVTRKCIAASELGRPRVSNPIIFDDTVGKVALLVTGTYRQAHMKGASGTTLCLFDRRTRTVATVEAEGWSSGRR
jgi:hypothetical protein